MNIVFYFLFIRDHCTSPSDDMNIDASFGDRQCFEIGALCSIFELIFGNGGLVGLILLSRQRQR